MDRIVEVIDPRVTNKIAYPIYAFLTEIQEDLSLPVHHNKMTKGGGHWCFHLLSESSHIHHYKHPEEHPVLHLTVSTSSNTSESLSSAYRVIKIESISTLISPATRPHPL